MVLFRFRMVGRSFDVRVEISSSLLASVFWLRSLVVRLRISRPPSYVQSVDVVLLCAFELRRRGLW